MLLIARYAVAEQKVFGVVASVGSGGSGGASFF
jgi:hypothetical protein